MPDVISKMKNTLILILLLSSYLAVFNHASTTIYYVSIAAVILPAIYLLGLLTIMIYISMLIAFSYSNLYSEFIFFSLYLPILSGLSCVIFLFVLVVKFKWARQKSDIMN